MMDQLGIQVVAVNEKPDEELPIMIQRSPDFQQANAKVFPT
jgi:hypothetical protein